MLPVLKKIKAMNNLKIFEIRWSNGNLTWMAGKTNMDALAHYVSSTDTSIYDWKDTDTIVELPEYDWSNYYIGYPLEVEERVSFREYMKTLYVPDIICEKIC